jgi:capsular exopolysaccharide synthesis family protein
MDSAVHSRADAVRAADVRVLGLVPHTRMLHDSGGLRRRVRFVPLPKRTLRLREAANEAYAWLETSLALLSTSGEIRTIAVTSPLAREGKTINSANLALSMARRGRRVLLIDADLRRGRIHQIFGMSKGPGLAEVLAGAVSTEQVIKRIKAGRGTTLDVMPGGELVGHPAELLRSPRMGDLLASLQASYDMIVCDTPPVNLVSDSLLLARMVDGVILVARAGVTDAQSLTEASRHLRDADAPLLGVLLNDIDPHRDRSYDHAYRYLDQAQSYAAVGES